MIWWKCRLFVPTKASFHTVLTHFWHPKALGTLPAIWNFWFVGALWKKWKRLASRLECHDCCTNFWTVCYIYKRPKHIRVPEQASGLNSATQIWVERIANLNEWDKRLDPSEVYQNVSSFAQFAPRKLGKKRSHLYRQRRWGPRRGPPRCCSSSTLLSQPMPSGLKPVPFSSAQNLSAPWKSQRACQGYYGFRSDVVVPQQLGQWQVGDLTRGWSEGAEESWRPPGWYVDVVNR